MPHTNTHLLPSLKPDVSSTISCPLAPQPSPAHKASLGAKQVAAKQVAADATAADATAADSTAPDVAAIPVSSHRSVCDSCITAMIYFQNRKTKPKHKLGYSCPFCRLPSDIPRDFVKDMVFEECGSMDTEDDEEYVEEGEEYQHSENLERLEIS